MLGRVRDFYAEASPEESLRIMAHRGYTKEVGDAMMYKEAACLGRVMGSKLSQCIE